MKLEPWEPDLRTLVARIEEGELDLQPDFQRGLAWSSQKQQRLIDTILRGWSIPPLHLLVLPEHRLAVLDGQQRLRAVLAFLAGDLKVGRWDPYDEGVRALAGFRYEDLPRDVQRRIRNYKVPTYRLYDYEPDEPYELFFRLNLPTGLTQAEKRNALVGDSRQQVKQLVHQATSEGWSQDTIGFANARMAYDDTVARACCYLEGRSLRIPLTAGELESQYRRKGGFSVSTVEVISAAIEAMARSLAWGQRPPLNKATLLTWLLAHARQVLDLALRDVDLGAVLTSVEHGRAAVRRFDERYPPDMLATSPVGRTYLELYNDRASSRVTDVLSVVARDAVVWRFASLIDSEVLESAAVERLVAALAPLEAAPNELEWRAVQVLENPDTWGRLG